jgi:hypothetical protein
MSTIFSTASPPYPKGGAYGGVPTTPTTTGRIAACGAKAPAVAPLPFLSEMHPLLWSLPETSHRRGVEHRLDAAPHPARGFGLHGLPVRAIVRLRCPGAKWGEGRCRSPLRSPIDAEVARYGGIQRKTKILGYTSSSVRGRDSMRRLEMEEWRMGWDSNPRGACTPAGFQDRCLQPLGHPSRVRKQQFTKCLFVEKPSIGTGLAPDAGS